MGLRFSKRIKLFPGVRLNVGLRGSSISVGPRGASLSAGKRGIHVNTSIPGTGFSYRTRLDDPKPQTAPSRRFTEELPPTPNSFTVRFLDETIEFVDKTGTLHDDAMAARIKAAFRDQLLPALEDRVRTLNRASHQLANVHLQTPVPKLRCPAPKGASSEYPIVKPVRPDDQTELSDYMQTLSDWRVAKAEFESSERNQVANLEAIADAVLPALSAIEWLCETNVELDLDPAGQDLHLNVDLPEIEMMPPEEYTLNRRNLTISKRPLSAAAIKRLYYRHVHAVLFRLAGEAFSSHGCLNSVHIASYTQRVSSATGRTEAVYVLQVKVTRSVWDQIDFGQLGALDPVLALERFELTRKHSPRGDLLEIETPYRG